MTMLTPLGSGGRSRRRRRRWPKVLLAVVVIVAVVAGAFAAWHWLGDDASTTITPQPTEVCRTPSLTSPKSLPAPDQASVQIANGTDRAGLAVDTADQLAAEGFDVTDIGNTARPVKQGVAQVRYTADDLATAITVASFIPRADLIEVKKLPNATVAVWLGPDFERVLSNRQADPSTVVLPTQKPVCHTPSS
jgi:cytoskeletal protein RodZ